MRDLKTLEMDLLFSLPIPFCGSLCLRHWWDKDGSFFTLRLEEI
jgi:hypothetical protein